MRADTLTADTVIAMWEQLRARDPIAALEDKLRAEIRAIEARGGTVTHIVVHASQKELGGEMARRLKLDLIASEFAPKESWYLMDAAPPSWMIIAREYAARRTAHGKERGE